MLIRLKKLFEIQGYLIFVICMLLVGIGVSITQPYISLYCTEDLGMSASAFGVFMAVSSLSGVVINSIIAKHSDSGLDRKWIIIVAMISSALAYASYLVFHNFFALLMVVSLLNGIGTAGMTQIYAYAQESANKSKSADKALALSSLRSLISAGFLVGPLGGAIIWAALGYAGLFLGTSIIYLALASLVLLFLKRRRVVEHHDARKISMGSSLKNRDIRYSLFAFILLFGVNTINSLNTPLFIMNVLQGTHAEIGLVVSVCAGLEIPIMIVLGAMGKKISNHALMIGGCFVAISYYSILSLSTHPWQLIAAQLLQATFVAIVMGNGLSYFANLLPHSPGLSTTIYSNGSTIGRLFGSLCFGIIAQYTGFRNVYWVCLALVISSLFILWRIRPHKEMGAIVAPTESV